MWGFQENVNSSSWCKTAWLLFAIDAAQALDATPNARDSRRTKTHGSTKFPLAELITEVL